MHLKKKTLQEKAFLPLPVTTEMTCLPLALRYWSIWSISEGASYTKILSWELFLR